MKFFTLLFFLSAIAISVSLQIISNKQEIKIEKLNTKIKFLNLDIEKITNNITYDTRPQNLKRINELEFNLSPILQEDLIKIKEEKLNVK